MTRQIRQVIGVSIGEDGLKVKEAASPGAPKLSQEEQESRRAIKRFRRQRRSERLLRAHRGSTAWLRQAKAVGRLTRAIQRSLPHLSAEEARRSAKASIKASCQVEDETKRHMQREIHGA